MGLRKILLVVSCFFLSSLFNFNVCYAVVTKTELETEISYVNAEIQSIQGKVTNKKFEDAQTEIDSLIVHLKDKFYSSYFYYSVLDVKRSGVQNYIPPTLKALPQELTPQFYLNKQTEISSKYHDIRTSLENAEQQLALKKYKAALNILVSAFSTANDIVNLMQTSGDPLDIIQLPGNLQDMVNKAKQDAKTIQTHIDSISTEKEKINLITEIRKSLVSIMHYIRIIGNFVSGTRLSLSELDDYLSDCQKQLDAAAKVQFHQSNPSSFDASRYINSLISLLADFKNGRIPKDRYINARNTVFDEAEEEYSAIEDPSESSRENYQKFLEDYHTESPTIICGNDYIYPYTFDNADLQAYCRTREQVQTCRTNWLNAANELIRAIISADFLMQDTETYGKPIPLTPVDISVEWLDYYHNFDTYALPGVSSANGTVVDKCNLDKGPAVLRQMYDYYGFVANHIYSYSEDPWIDEVSEYLDRLKERAWFYYHGATIGIKSEPHFFTSQVTDDVYGVSLLNRDKILDLRNNIQAIYDEMGKFSGDWDDMCNNCFGGSSNISQKLQSLKKSYNDFIALKGQPYVSSSDFDLKWDLNYPGDSWKIKLFFNNGFVEKMRFNDTMFFVNSAKKEIDYAYSFLDEIYDRITSYQQILDNYIREISDTIEFNDDLENGELQKIIDNLSKFPDYRDYLEWLLEKINSFKSDFSDAHYLQLQGMYNQIKHTYSASDAATIGRELKKLEKYMDKIRNGFGLGSYEPESRLFYGTLLIFPENRDLIDQIGTVCWPTPTYGGSFGRQNTNYLIYLNPEQICAYFPNVAALLAQYEPEPPEPTNYKITSASGNKQKTRPNKRLPKKISVTIKNTINNKPASNIWITFRLDINDITGGKVEPVRYGQVVQQGGNGTFYTTTDNNGVAEVWWTVGDQLTQEDGTPVTSVWGLAAEVMGSEGGDQYRFRSYNLSYVDFQGEDSNQNDIPDEWENTYSVNGEPLAGELLKIDFDGDGLTSEEEYYSGTNPFNSDSDGDGMPDGWEIQYDMDPQGAYDGNLDYDGDGLLNKEEAEKGFDPSDINSPAGGVSWPTLKLGENNKIQAHVRFRNIVLLSRLVIKAHFKSQSFSVESVKVVQDGVSYQIDEPDGEITFTWGGEIPAGERTIATIAFLLPLDETNLDTFTLEMIPVEVLDSKGENVEGMFAGSAREMSTINIAAGTLPGNINGDNDVTLADAILTLQVAAHMSPDGVRLSGDVNGDGRIGLEEAIYDLQYIAGVQLK